MEEEVVGLWRACSAFNCYSQHKQKGGHIRLMVTPFVKFLDGTLIGFYALFYLQAVSLVNLLINCEGSG